jgi:trk system potassium uptake protein
MKQPRTLKRYLVDAAIDLWTGVAPTSKHWPLGVSLVALLAAIWLFGVSDRTEPGLLLFALALSSMVLGLTALGIRYCRLDTRPPVQAWIPDLLYALLLLWSIMTLLPCTFMSNELGRLAFWVPGIVFFREFANYPFFFRRRNLQPAQLFIASFILVIILGTLLLKAPNATHSGISFLDALFTSTSAVCVTGLIVVDTATHFTRFGQWVLIFLMQIGGLGVMTFTTYFAYFFRGGMSYESQLMLNDMSNSKKLSDVFDTLKRVILLTLGVEVLGALLIYLSLSGSATLPESERIFFAIFHCVSRFCNAGFSTLTNGLFEAGFNTNYPLLSVVMGLFILGGIGFPIMHNFWCYVKYRIKQALFLVLGQKTPHHQPWIIEVNSRIVLFTTGILLFVGTLTLYLFEYQNTLADHHGFGKIIAALFCASTPRTAGFNMVDTSAMLFPSIMLILFLMWIGASPSSTGGGIKPVRWP